MSWTNQFTESNNFKVQNSKEVQSLLEALGFNVNYNEAENSMQFSSEDGAYIDDLDKVVLSPKTITKADYTSTNFVGVISDKVIESVDINDIGYGLTEKDVIIKNVLEYLQEKLLENEYITITSAGFESRNSGSFSPFGEVTVITKDIVKSNSLYSITESIKETLGIN